MNCKCDCSPSETFQYDYYDVQSTHPTHAGDDYTNGVKAAQECAKKHHTSCSLDDIRKVEACAKQLCPSTHCEEGIEDAMYSSSGLCPNRGDNPPGGGGSGGGSWDPDNPPQPGGITADQCTSDEMKQALQDYGGHAILGCDGGECVIGGDGRFGPVNPDDTSNCLACARQCSGGGQGPVAPPSGPSGPVSPPSGPVSPPAGPVSPPAGPVSPTPSPGKDAAGFEWDSTAGRIAIGAMIVAGMSLVLGLVYWYTKRNRRQRTRQLLR